MTNTMQANAYRGNYDGIEPRPGFRAATNEEKKAIDFIACWQPIKTAPKDQSQKERLLGFDHRYGVRIIKYDGWGGGTGNFEIALDDIDIGENGDAPYDFAPTHWMPLPNPPVVKD